MNSARSGCQNVFKSEGPILKNGKVTIENETDVGLTEAKRNSESSDKLKEVEHAAMSQFKELIVSDLTYSIEKLDFGVRNQDMDTIKSAQKRLRRFRSDLVSVYTVLESTTEQES